MNEPTNTEPGRVLTRAALRWVERWLRHLAGHAVADALIDDLTEAYHALVTRDGAGRARWWLCWQLLSAIPAVRRLRALVAARGRNRWWLTARRRHAVGRWVGVAVLVLLAAVTFPWWHDDPPATQPPMQNHLGLSARASPPQRPRSGASAPFDPQMIRILPNPDPEMCGCCLTPSAH